MEQLSLPPELDAEEPSAAASAPSYAPGSLLLDVLRRSVPSLTEAVRAALLRAFEQESAEQFTVPPLPDRAVDLLPPRLGRELLCWARRCEQAVPVPPAWLTPGGLFLPGAVHRREVLGMLCRLWAAQAELAAAEAALPAPRGRRRPAPAAASTSPLWVVDFRRLSTAEEALSGAIPVVSLDGRESAVVPEPQATLLRSRSPRLQDALRVGFANHEHWRCQSRSALAELAGCAVVSEECARLDEQRVSFVDSPGGLECKSCVYFLDTYDESSLHRPGPMASQVYVGLVGVKEHANGEALNNTLRKRMEQHRGGTELLVDMELHNPAMAAPGLATPPGASVAATDAPPPALLLALDWGLPGLAGEHSVGALEGHFIRYFDAMSPLGLNAGCTAPHGLARGELDAVRGTSCHWCRQKTDSLKAKCASCPIAFCQPCLLIRHGLAPCDIGPDWNCPKCMGNCNCSVCRRKAGLEPTGVMGAQALAAGFAGVAQYLAATQGDQAGGQPAKRRQAALLPG